MALSAEQSTGAPVSLSDVHLGRLLQERGFINEHQLVDALRAQAASGGRLGTILVRRGCLSNVQLEAALRTQDELRRAGVAMELGLVAAEAPTRRSVTLGLTVVVPPAGNLGGLPHHGVSARQQILVPQGWLPSCVAAVDLTGAGNFELTAADGRMVDYGVGLSIRASEDTLHLQPGRTLDCPAAAPREDDYGELTVLVRLAPDSLRDGGAGRFTGRFELCFDLRD